MPSREQTQIHHTLRWQDSLRDARVIPPLCKPSTETLYGANHSDPAYFVQRAPNDQIDSRKNLLVYRKNLVSITVLTNHNATEHHPPLELQEYFREQRSVVQEVIEAAGHLYLFLPKFHYELNYMGDGESIFVTIATLSTY